MVPSGCGCHRSSGTLRPAKWVCRALAERTGQLHGGAALESGGSAQNESNVWLAINVTTRAPGWVSVNAFAHVQLREGACARVDTRARRLPLGQYAWGGSRRVGRAHSAAEAAIPVALVVDFRALQAASRECRARLRKSQLMPKRAR